MSSNKKLINFRVDRDLLDCFDGLIRNNNNRTKLIHEFMIQTIKKDKKAWDKYIKAKFG